MRLSVMYLLQGSRALAERHEFADVVRRLSPKLGDMTRNTRRAHAEEKGRKKYKTITFREKRRIKAKCV